LIATRHPPRLLLVGNNAEEHVGAHFRCAAEDLGVDVELADVRESSKGHWLSRKFSWHFLGHRPAQLAAFSRHVVRLCARFRPHVLLTVGIAPLDAGSLEEIGRMGVYRANYLTDDPWNPAQKAPWFMLAIRHYDEVFSTRRSNLDDLRATGCGRVTYLRFAYAPAVHFPHRLSAARKQELASDVIFAGGGDADRVPYIAALARAGFRVALYGGYWNRFPETRRLALGLKDPAFLREAVSAARIALCLVRHANRDGHCMRTFEVPAIGACMLVENTEEHRELFGAEGSAVMYFDSIPEMLQKARWLLDHPGERQRLRDTVHQLITTGGHTYHDRLRSVLAMAADSEAVRGHTRMETGR
jgi:spore maturation protein CgeB